MILITVCNPSAVVGWNGEAFKTNPDATKDSDEDSHVTFYHPFDSGETSEWFRIARWEDKLVVNMMSH